MLDLGGNDFGIGGAGAILQADAGYAMPVGAESRSVNVYDPGDLIDQRFRDPNNGLATLDEGEFFYSGGTSNLLNISYYTKSDDNDVTLTHPGRYDFNGFGGQRPRSELRAVSPFQTRPAATRPAGWGRCRGTSNAAAPRIRAGTNCGTTANRRTRWATR